MISRKLAAGVKFNFKPKRIENKRLHSMEDLPIWVQAMYDQMNDANNFLRSGFCRRESGRKMVDLPLQIRYLYDPCIIKES